MATARFDIPCTNRLARLPVAQLNAIYARVLADAVNDNDPARVKTKGDITRFHSKVPPPLEIEAYLTRLTKFTPFPHDAVLLSALYLNRISHFALSADATSTSTTVQPRALVPSVIPPRVPTPVAIEPALNPRRSLSPTDAPFPASPDSDANRPRRASPLLNIFTLHRLVLSTLLVATKFTCDGTLSQARAAKVGGVSRGELGRLESETLRLLGWELMFGLDEVEALSRALSERGEKDGLLIKREDSPSDNPQGGPPTSTASTSSVFEPSSERLPTHPFSCPTSPPRRPFHSRNLSTSSHPEHDDADTSFSSVPSSSSSSPRLFSPHGPRTRRISRDSDHVDTPPSSPSDCSNEGGDCAASMKEHKKKVRELYNKNSSETVRMLQTIALKDENGCKGDGANNA
ncbi:hypothetical protein JCM21900_003736 [Sporobolomyces salmonicolor]